MPEGIIRQLEQAVIEGLPEDADVNASGDGFIAL